MSAAMCPLILPVNTKDIGRNSLISVSKPIIKKGGEERGVEACRPLRTLQKERERASRSGSSAATSTFSQKPPFFE